MIPAWRGRLLLAAFGLALGLGLGEITARIILPRLPAPEGAAWIPDPDCGFRLRPSPPGSLPEGHPDFINTFGFRDRNHPVAKPEGVRRILGLGDSFVFGAVPPAENFLKVCERALGAAGDSLRTEMVLMGAPGYSPEHEADLLESFGLGLDPDLVVACFFVGNDVTGIPVRGRVLAGRMYHPHSPIGWLDVARRSQLFQLAEGVVYRGLKERWSGPEVAARPGETASPEVSPLYLKILASNIPVYLKNPGHDLEDLWAEALGHLDRIDAACRARNVPWLLMVIPGEEQVDPVVRGQVLTGLGFAEGDHDFDGPQRRLREWAGARSVPILDLLPVMRAAHCDTARLYVPNDTHWNRRGNAVAGAALAAELTARVIPR